MAFRFAIRSAEAWGLNRPDGKKSEDAIESDLDIIDNQIEDYLTDLVDSLDTLEATVTSISTYTYLGSASRTTDQTGLSGTIADLTSLAVTVTVPSGARVKITGKAELEGDTAGNAWGLMIRESSTTLQRRIGHVITANESDTAEVSVVLTPSAGSHSYKLSAQRLSGAGALAMRAGSTNPAFILVEALWPA